MGSWPDIDRLYMLVEFERLGSLAATAKSLRYSPSAISQQMSTLQKELGVKLVTKRGKALELTEEGLLMAKVGHDIILQLEAARSSLAAATDSVKGKLRVSCLQTVTQELLPAVICEMKSKHPDFTVDLVQGESPESLESLIGGTVNVAIAEQFEGQPREELRDDLSKVELFSEPMWLIANKEQSGGLHPSTEQLQDADWIFEPLSSPCGKWALDWCRRQGFEPKVRYESEDLLSHLRLVEAGLAVGFIPHLLLPRLTESMSVFQISPTENRTVYLSTRFATSHHPGVTELVDHLKDAYAKKTEPISD